MDTFRDVARRARRTYEEADVLALCEEYERLGCALYPADESLLRIVFGGPPPGWTWTRYEAGHGGHTNLRRVGGSDV